MIWPEQGYGDQIQFARFVPQLILRGASVSVVSKPELAPVLSHLANHRPSGVADHDYWITPASLPGLLGVTVDTVPQGSYIPAHQPISPSRRIGVVWQGNPTHANNANRSFGPGVFKPLTDLGCQLVPLAPELSGAKTFADTARLIDQLDAVVSVDTAVAHLAGAMGRPVYIALPFIRPDWRWMRDRTDSPWYASARLYRQDSSLDWAPVIEAIRADLSRRYR